MGIGTSSPSATYSLDATKPLRVSSAAPAYELQETDATNQRWSVFGLGGDLTFRDVTNNVYAMTLKSSTGNVGIGTSSPARKFTVQGASGDTLPVRIIGGSGTTTSGLEFQDPSTTADYKVQIGSVGDNLYLRSGGAERMRINSAGNVGIGTSSPDTALHVEGAASTYLQLERTVSGSEGKMLLGAATNFNQIISRDSGTGAKGIQVLVGTDEAMRIDSSGNLLLGKTVADNTTQGIRMLGSAGFASFVRDGAEPIVANRLTNDGDLIELRKDGTAVGSIGTVNGDIFVGTGNTALRFTDGAADIRPVNSSGANLDATTDLGASATRFKDLYLSGGVYLGGTAAANKLDDYEEGTFTATLTPETSGTITMNSSFDKLAYTKIGRVVTITGRIKVSAVSSPVGQYVRLSLPFAIGNDDEESERPTGTVTLQNAAQDIDKYCIHPTSGTASYIQIGRTDNFASNAAPDFSGNELLSIALTYIT